MESAEDSRLLSRRHRSFSHSDYSSGSIDSRINVAPHSLTKSASMVDRLTSRFRSSRLTSFASGCNSESIDSAASSIPSSASTTLSASSSSSVLDSPETPLPKSSLVWQKAIDPQSGRTFYYDQDTGETQWNKPSTMAATPEEAEVAAKREKDLQAFFRSMEANIIKKLSSPVISEEKKKDDYHRPLQELPPPQEIEEKDSEAEGEERDTFSSGISTNPLLQIRLPTTTPQRRPLSRPGKSRSGKSKFTRTISSMEDHVFAELVSDDKIKSANCLSLQNSSEGQSMEVVTLESMEFSELSIPSSNRKSPPLRRNSGGTLYVGSTMSVPDVDATIKCVCAVIRSHILQSSREDKTNFSLMRHLDYNVHVFNDNPNDRAIEPGTFETIQESSSKDPRLKSSSDVRGSPNTSTGCSGTNRKGFDKEMRRSSEAIEHSVDSEKSDISCSSSFSEDADDDNNSMEEDNHTSGTGYGLNTHSDDSFNFSYSSDELSEGGDCEPPEPMPIADTDLDDANVPTLEDLTKFYRDVFHKSQMESDCIIISLIYIERLVKETNGMVRPRSTNWKSIIFSSMIMASKVWDDLSMWNADFSQLSKRFTLQRINELEIAILKALRFCVKVPASEYAKYYFLLRYMLIRSGLGSDAFSSSVPLDINGAEKFETLSSGYGKTAAKKIRRAASFDEIGLSSRRPMKVDKNADNPSPCTGERRSVSIEQLVNMSDRLK